MRALSSLTARLASLIAVDFVALAPPAARADEFVRVGDCPEREWPAVPAQIRWSLERALLVVEGRLHIASARAKAGEVEGPRDFGTASLAIDRTLKGATPGSPLEVELPAYSPTEPSWWQSLTDRTSLEELAERLRNLERELVDGDIGEAAYQGRRKELRSRMLRSPAYRDADRYLLVRVRISRGLDDPPYRDADVLLEEGASYVLMAFTPPSRSGGLLRLRERALDIRSTQRFMNAVPPGGPEESGAGLRTVAGGAVFVIGSTVRAMR